MLHMPTCAETEPIAGKEMKALLFIALAFALLTLVTRATAQLMPQPKTGQCPGGYRESGGYYAPTSDRAQVAIPKVGQCPAGFVQSAFHISSPPESSRQRRVGLILMTRCGDRRGSAAGPSNANIALMCAPLP